LHIFFSWRKNNLIPLPLPHRPFLRHLYNRSSIPWHSLRLFTDPYTLSLWLLQDVHISIAQVWGKGSRRCIPSVWPNLSNETWGPLNLHDWVEAYSELAKKMGLFLHFRIWNQLLKLTTLKTKFRGEFCLSCSEIWCFTI
jgi:hypothetical protein